MREHCQVQTSDCYGPAMGFSSAPIVLNLNSYMICNNLYDFIKEVRLICLHVRPGPSRRDTMKGLD